MKTNSKKAVEGVKNYILENVEAETISEAVEVIADTFINEYYKGYNKQRNIQTLFYEWASGLPMGSLFDYFINGECQEILGGILEQTKEEAEKYDYSKSEFILTYMIYKQCCNSIIARV